MWFSDDLLGGLSWPSVSFAILVGSLLLSMIVLWRRFLSRRLLLERIAELEALSVAGRAIAASVLDVNALCELIADEAGKVIDNRTFQVGLFEGPAYAILYWKIDGERVETPRIFDLSDESGVVGWVRDSKRALLVRDFISEFDSLPAKPRYVSNATPRSAIFIPLISGEEVLGCIAAQSPKVARFDEEDLRRLTILANQAASGIANAKLYQQAQTRARQLELVGKIAREINAVDDREGIFRQVVQLTQNTFGFQQVSIYCLEPETGELLIQASNASELLEHNLRLTVGQGIVGTAVATRQRIVSNNTVEDARFLATAPGLPESSDIIMSELAIPLIVNDEILGVLDVQSEDLGAFSPVEITALEALAAEVAISIHKARQMDQQREQAWLTTAQLQIAESLDMNPGLDEICDTIARLTVMLLGTDLCGILLWDEEMTQYQGHALYGTDTATIESFGQTQLTIGDWAPLDAVHVGQEMLTTTQKPPWPIFSGNRASSMGPLTLVPISSKEVSLGVMFIRPLVSAPKASGNLLGSPNMQRNELLLNITKQTAQAIESARLRIAQQEEAWVNTALLQVAEAVNSLIDLNEILDIIVRLAPMLVGVHSAVVLIWDEEQEHYRLGPSHGLSAMGRGLLEAQGIDTDEFLSLATSPTEFPANHAPPFSLRLPPWLVKVLNTSLAHAFPLHARGRVVGILMVGADPETRRPFSSRRLNILNGIAHQAATAVVNDQLYKEWAERSRLEQELDVAREIQKSLIPEGNPDIPGSSVASFWQAARQVSGDFYDFVQLPNGNWSIVIADVADKGVPAALYMALSRTIIRTVAYTRSDPADALMRANQIIDADSHSDLFVTAFYGVWNPSSGIFAYANGGHNPPLLLRKNGESQQLTGAGMALGVLPRINVESKYVMIEPGDILLLYTDGITEAMNEDFDEFGVDRLRFAAESSRLQDAAAIKDSIIKAISEHTGDTPQFDDITLVVLKRQEPHGAN